MKRLDFWAFAAFRRRNPACEIAPICSWYVRKETLMSSQIEGTQATLEDVLDPMLDANTNRNVADVVNYIKATEFAINRLQTLPLCNRLIKETHAVLMEGVRGQEKSPGEFRYSQNWIGGQSSTLKNARYIPPSPDDMLDAMSDLEKYINADDDLDALIRAAKNAMLVFNYLESNPIIEIRKTAESLGITFNTTSSAVNRLVDAGILVQTSDNSRNRTFAYEAYLDILRKGT